MSGFFKKLNLKIKTIMKKDNFQSLYNHFMKMAENAKQSVEELKSIPDSDALIEVWKEKAIAYTCAANQLNFTCAMSNIFLDQPLPDQENILITNKINLSQPY